MSRLPIRVRLTLVFALALAVVLAAAGFALYGRLESSLDGTIDQGLRTRAADIGALAGQSDAGLREAPLANGFAQILAARGRIVDATPGFRTPLLSTAQLGRTPLRLARLRVDGQDVRVLAVPVHAQDQRLTIVVAAPLAGRDQALSNLRQELVVGGPIALLLAALIGYVVAGATLRPVERMRARAAEISARDLSERLPVPHARDEIGALGATLNELLARLETALRRERQFVADASHELRTPLALLRAEVELALEAPQTEAEQRDALRSVGEEVDRLSQLAEDLLLLARVDEGELRLRTEPTELDALLEGVAARFARRAGEAGRHIETDGAGLEIDGDRLRLQQAVSNLVENALRHGAGTIRLFGVARDGGAEIHVSDEGHGFPAGFAERAFERFTRADEARSGPGAGLGLAIVQAVAEAHGGKTGIGTRPGGGADVWLTTAVTSRAAVHHVH